MQTVSKDVLATSSATSIPTTAVGLDATNRRIVGLDSLRFVCALLVVGQHVGLLPDRLHGSQLTGLSRMAVGIYNCLFNGAAAVIVFFLVSGFCIHFPFRRGRKLVLGTFYGRRFVRIAAPAAAYYLLVCATEKRFVAPVDTILWSVICEAVYYLLYPALLRMRGKLSWTAMVVLACIIASVLLVTHVDALAWGMHGYPALRWLTWIVGLPCWLLGCWLAENFSRFPVLTSLQMWTMRVALYVCTVILDLLHFHVSAAWASNCVLLDLFAVPACAWLGFEIAYASVHPPRKALEWAGGWSYSLYLVHPLVPALLALCGLSFIDLQPQTHFLVIGLVLVASFGFFLLIERPSHLYATRIGRRVQQAPAIGVQPA